jgi:hypothetical protein
MRHELRELIDDGHDQSVSRIPAPSRSVFREWVMSLPGAMAASEIVISPLRAPRPLQQQKIP